MAAAVVGAGWVTLLGAILRQPVFLTTDMVSNHVHVWFLADQIWHEHRIPLHMPVLASGDAYTFPYAAPAWLVGALVWPLGGDHAVTALFVAGAVAVLVATFWALPALRRGWWAVAVLLDPVLFTSVMLGQLPFLWAAALFMGAIGMWRRERMVAATVLAAISMVTHPAVMVPISLIAVAFALPVERRRAGPTRLLACWAIAFAVTVPAMVLTFASPVVTQTSRLVQLASLVTTVLVRVLVLAVPIALDVLARSSWPVTSRRGLPIVVCGVFVVLGALMWHPFQLDVGWSGVTRTAMPDELASFATTPPLQPGRVYRILPGADQKYGHYLVVRNGGILDSELFPESLRRESFDTVEDYGRFLAERRIESVVVTPGYAGHFRSNEPARLEELAASVACVDGIRVATGPAGATWQQYDVTRC